MEEKMGSLLLEGGRLQGAGERPQGLACVGRDFFLSCASQRSKNVACSVFILISQNVWGGRVAYCC